MERIIIRRKDMPNPLLLRNCEKFTLLVKVNLHYIKKKDVVSYNISPDRFFSGFISYFMNGVNYCYLVFSKETHLTQNTELKKVRTKKNY